jgi:3-phenylpropionate/trans-cinnamate dioxygenase ferredoxin reductase component
MPRSRVVILGGGQGGFQTALSLREQGFDGRIALVGDEPDLPYQRPPLSKAYLAGSVDAEAVRLRPQAFYTHHDIDLLSGERASTIDRPTRRLLLASGATLAYDHLVLGVGARPRRLAIPGADLDGVMELRTLADATLLRQRLATTREVVLIGAGFIGLEFAAVAAKQGKAVRIVEATGRAMARVVSPPVSRCFAAAHARWGAELLFETSVVRVLGEPGRVVGVETTRGEILPADLVVVCVGVVPNVELATEAGLATDDGIVVNAELATADPAISAIGDCARYPSRFAEAMVRLESVQNAVDQARCVAARLAGHPAPYQAVPWFWSDQGELRLQIVGLTMGHDQAVLRGEPDQGRFSVFCFRDGRLIGIESVNRPADHIAGRRILAGALDLSPEQAADSGYDLKAHAAGQVASAPAQD